MQLLAFDQVINKQRLEMYTIRRQVLENDEVQLHSVMRDYCRKTVSDIINANFEGSKRDKIVEKALQFFPTLGPVDQEVGG